MYSPTTRRWRLDVEGRVQGVGFRPHVVRLARELGLAGLVGNDSQGAFIEIEGAFELLERFVVRLGAELPPLARLSRLQQRELSPEGACAFVIVHSEAQAEQRAEIAPDVCLCADCERELLDPADRRYHYPFINCTNCGPRYSIIRAVPYDRPLTTMAAFRMCANCQREYDDPGHRRYHAQPNACPVCGPRLRLVDPLDRVLPGDQIGLALGPPPLFDDSQRCRGPSLDPLSAAVALLRAGQIVAIKGIGGVHLACLASDEAAVARLRERKGREAKPFALMVPSLERARALCRLDDDAAALLTSLARPIVLLERRPEAAVAASVAPDNPRLGLMLPYTPLHVLLLRALDEALVMTSGNRSDEPLCFDDADAVSRLGPLCDALLLHDRPIERPIDDSVVLPHGDSTTMLRRARGYVPSPLSLPVAAARPILAVGGDLKATVCLATDERAVLSEHLGDLEHPEAFRAFLRAIERLRQLLRCEPRVLAHDLHPSYHGARWARAQAGYALVGVQHHHAHMASAMAEHGLEGSLVGIVCDGTGYGSDGSIWGAEILCGDAADFERVGGLESVPLLGGDAAAEQPWRPAGAFLLAAYGDEAERERERFGPAWSDEQWTSLRARFGRGKWLGCSSMGRLFDAVAFLLGVCDHNRFEAEAAQRLETEARRAQGAPPLAFPLDGQGRLASTAAIRELLARQARGEDRAELALAFHLGVAEALALSAARAARDRGLERVVLSGGSFANRLLLARCTEVLTSHGLRVYPQQSVPTGDGGLALGQAYVAAARLRAAC